jgi:hypothetical protein
MRQRKFIPPTRVVPREVEIKIEPVDLMDEDRPTTAQQGEEEEDVKPSVNELQRGIVEGKRKRSQTPEGREIKPTIPGSKDMPIEVDEVDEIDEVDNNQPRAQIPRPPRADGRPVIIRNVVYKIYNVVNGAVQPEAPDPPPAAPLPGGLQAVPEAPPAPHAPPAAIEELDEDFVPMNYVAPALPQPILDPEPEIPTLSKSQQEILDTVLDGKSVLIHGSAGTGKSVLIRAIKKAFEDRYEADNPLEPKRDPIDARVLGNYPRMQMSAQDRVAHPLPEKKWKLRVTASTGMAAV